MNKNTSEGRLSGVATSTWYNTALEMPTPIPKDAELLTQDYDLTNTPLCKVRLIRSDSLGFLHCILLYTTDISVVCPNFTL